MRTVCKKLPHIIASFEAFSWCRVQESVPRSRQGEAALGQSTTPPLGGIAMTYLLRRIWVKAAWMFAVGALFLSPAAFGAGDCKIECETCIIAGGKATCTDCTITGCSIELAE